MDTVKVAKDYFLSSQSSLLIPNREYGARKLIQVSGLPKSPLNLSNLPTPHLPFRNPAPTSGRARVLPTRHSDSSLLHHRRIGGNHDSTSGASQAMKSSGKKWLHASDTLLKGELSYNVKFLGECAVDQPKGTEVVKDAIRKRKFNKHVKRAEGEKPPKVSLIISANGLRIEHPKTKAILHEYPLHRISYCADDKSDKKMFTFIAKAATTNDHYCYVFNCSDKSAEEITLTVGQAFDLAYKRFMQEGRGSDIDFKKQCLQLQRRVSSLQFENDALKKRVAELEKLKDRSDLEEYMKNNQIASLTTVMLSLRDSSDGDETDETSDDFELQRQPGEQPQVGRRLQNLGLQGDSLTPSNGHSSGSAPTPLLSPPPPSTRQTRNGAASVSGPIRQQSLPTNTFSSAEAAGDASNDPFGMGAFNPSNSAPAPVTSPNGAAVPQNNVDIFGMSPEQELLDIQAGFSRGLAFGTDDFNLDDLDPLNQKP